MANKSFSSAKAALVCSFRATEKNRRHLGCGNVMRSRGCAVQNKGITLFILLVHNFVVNEGNSATEAFSSSPSAFAKHTHTTIWLNTISSYFEMLFPSQSSLQYRQINIYLARKRKQSLIPEALSELPESSPIPFTLGKLAKITRSKIYLFSEAIWRAQICFLLDVLHIKTNKRKFVPLFDFGEIHSRPQSHSA